MFEGKLYSPLRVGEIPGLCWNFTHRGGRDLVGPPDRRIGENTDFKVKEKDLVALFAVMQAEEDSLMDEDDGQPFYDSMMDWVDADDEERDEGAEDQYYEDLEPPYFTPGKKSTVSKNSG